ncbi:MAG: metalloregulator ArsR/SmtB family transcription factor, partial [Acidimicrobiales bacterium]
MSNENVVELGRLLGDTTRVALLDAMFDGRAYTVTELRRHVGVAASTASEHLSKLLDGGLLAIEPQGRHRYYRLRDAAVADLLETLFEFGTSRPVLRSSKVPADVAFGRTCYDHLAGTVAVG